MLNLLVFNWNYNSYLVDFLDSVSCLKNSSKVRVFFVDDGSTDESIETLKNHIIDKDISNFHLSLSGTENLGRKYPAFGQLEGLKRVLNSQVIDIEDSIWFMDVDDTFDFSNLDIIYDELERGNDVTFLNLHDKNLMDGSIKEYPISRKIDGARNKEIWPSISPTSSIIIKARFIDSWHKILFDFSSDFSELWLDARVNILAQKYCKVSYSDIVVYRNIHGGNDSLNIGFFRALNKQLQACSFFDRYTPSDVYSPRLQFLRFVNAFFKKFV